MNLFSFNELLEDNKRMKIVIDNLNDDLMAL